MPRSARAALALLLCLTLVGAAAGCGGDDTGAKNDYISAIQEARSSFEARMQELQDGLQVNSTAVQDRKTLGDFQGAIDTVVKRLDDVKPPKGVESEHKALIELYGRYGRVVKTARTELAGGTIRDQKKARVELSSSIRELEDRLRMVIIALNDALRS